MNRKIQEQTLRIMDALSGVDEELLEKCDGAGKGGESRKGYGKVFRFGSLCAACLCAVLVGTIAKRGFLPGKDSADSGQGNEAPLPESAAEFPEYGLESAAAPPEYGLENGECGEVETGEGIGGIGEPEWIDLAELRKMTVDDAAGGEAGVQQKKENKEATMETVSCVPEAASSESASETMDAENIPYGTLSETERVDLAELKKEMRSEEWQEACAQSGLGEYVPSMLPEEYSRQGALGRTGAEGESNLLLSWSDGEHMLWLNLTETDLNPEGKYLWTFPIFNAEKDWQEQLPEPEEDGSRRFAVLYREGVLAEYAGWLTEEEIRELFRSIPGPEEAEP